MRIFWMLPVLTPLLLAACDPRPESELDPKSILKLLSSEQGPSVTGVNETLLDSAHQAEQKKQYGRALQFYQQLIDKDKENPIYILGMADSLRRLNQFDEAIAQYDSLLKKQPDNVDALEGKGLTLLNKGEFDAASELFKSVLAKDGKRWRTFNAVAILFVMKQMPNEALSYYNEALKVKPEEPAILNNVGLTLALNDDYDRAIDALERASRKLDNNDPQKKRADLNLALVYGLAGDMEKAEEVAARHLRESALNNNLGFYAYLADNRDLAKAYLNNALSGSPTFYEKAWKNLEVVGGSKVERSQIGRQRKPNHSYRSYNENNIPFSIYPPQEETQSPPVAAPVMPVTSGNDLEAPKTNTMPLPPSLPAIQEPPTTAPASIPQNPNSINQNINTGMQPVSMLAPGDSHVEVFPAVPVNPMLENGLKPVSMPVQQPEQADWLEKPAIAQPLVAAPSATPSALAPAALISPQAEPDWIIPQTEAQANTVTEAAPQQHLPTEMAVQKVSAKVKDKPIEKPKKTTDSKLQEVKGDMVITKTKQKHVEKGINQVVDKSQKTHLAPEKTPSAKAKDDNIIITREKKEVSETAELNKREKLKNPRADIIVFQAKPKPKTASEAVTDIPKTLKDAQASDSKASSNTPLKTTLKPREAKTAGAEEIPANVVTTGNPKNEPENLKAMPEAAEQQSATTPNTESPAASVAQPVQPGERKSTIEYIKQIF